MPGKRVEEVGVYSLASSTTSRETENMVDAMAGDLHERHMDRPDAAPNDFIRGT